MSRRERVRFGAERAAPVKLYPGVLLRGLKICITTTRKTAQGNIVTIRPDSIVLGANKTRAMWSSRGGYLYLHRGDRNDAYEVMQPRLCEPLERLRRGGL